MNAQIKRIGKLLAEEREYIAANQPEVATQLARQPANRSEVMGEIAANYDFALVMSLNDDAELGRWIRAKFWQGMQDKARDECEYRLAERDILLTHGASIAAALGIDYPNPISQEESGE